MVSSSLAKILTFTASRYHTSATVFDPPLNFLTFLQFSIDHRSLRLAQQTHAQILRSGCDQNSFFATKLISAYALCGDPGGSHLVFKLVNEKNVYLWNSLINGFVKNHEYFKAVGLFDQMHCDNIFPDDYTLATMSKVAGELESLVLGRLIHGKGVRYGFVTDTVVANSLMSMYSKCREPEECKRLFDEMPQRNLGTWNVLVAGYASSGNCHSNKEVWEVFKRMQNQGIRPDAFTTSSLLPLCRNDTGKLNYGRELHCYILRNGIDWDLGSDVHLGCCLVDMYSRNKKVAWGRRVFDRMRNRNVFAWTAMINGYAQNGDPDQAIILFRDMMMRDKIEPNKVSLVSILPACSLLAGLSLGKQVHGFTIRKDLNRDVSLCNALIDMYSKCGNLYYARKIFDDDSFSKDAISWSSMICGYGLHGKGEEAIMLYEEMLQLGIKPDMITTVGLLSACCRSGLVDEGLKIYHSAVNVHGIEPTVEMCSCVVDILGRAGQLARALDFIKEMPIEPGPSVWGAFLNASEIHGDSDMQELAYKFLVQIEPENPSNYVSISNLYASSKRWDVVAEVRTHMKDKGLRKAPGCSWITINNETHCFFAADKAHPHSNSIYKMLDELVSMMTAPGNFPKYECDVDS